jgi:hypothetical protein
VSARLGHRDSGVTLRIYIHAYESAQRSAARTERLEAMYGEGNIPATPNAQGVTIREFPIEQATER